MSRIENFIEEVEGGRYLTLVTGFIPVVDEAIPALKRISEIFPELHINPDKELKILIHTRASFNAQNN